jgi:UDPglucose--hexose-1-phosphate uridylyltransferase
MSEIRRDRINNKYVLIAPERLHRPDIHKKCTKRESLKGNCPFCEGNESLTPSEIFAVRDNEADKPGWRCRVVPNLYKAVQIESVVKSSRNGVFETRSGVGAHEIIIDSPCHKCNFDTLHVENIKDWLNTISFRVNDLKNDKRLIYLSIFKNYGVTAGATQEHPHTQLIALPIMPGSQQHFLERNLKYYKRHGRGKLEDILANELSHKSRIVNQIGDFISFCPFASSFPFEVMIAPIRTIPTIDCCSMDDFMDLSMLIKDTFKRLKNQLGDFDYNLSIKIPPLNSNFENEEFMPYIAKNFRFYMGITPRIYRLGGFEISLDMIINPLAPEEAAKLLRESKLATDR